MTAQEAYELTTNGGATDFARVVALCRGVGPFCLIGGLAVNCYVEPVYTLDADFVMVATALTALEAKLRSEGFTVESFPHSLNAQPAKSQLRLQFTTDARYQAFPQRATEREVLAVKVPVAALEDIVQGKLWSWSDPQRRVSKRKKDEADLLRLAEKYPELLKLLPPALRSQLE